MPSKRRAGSDAADLGAPSHHGGRLVGGNRRRPGARDHLGAKGCAHVLQHARRLEPHAGVGRGRLDRLGIDAHGLEGIARPTPGIGLGQQALDRWRALGGGLAQDGQSFRRLPVVAQDQRQDQRPHRVVGKALQALARNTRGIVVAAQVAIGPRRGEQGIVRGIGTRRLLENRDRLGGLAVLLQERGEVHRHQAVVGAGGQHGAQRRLGLGHVAGARLQHRRLALLGGGLRPTGSRAEQPGNQDRQPNDRLAGESRHRQNPAK